MKKLISLIAVLVMLFTCAAVAEESEDMRNFYNPEGYDMLYVSDIFTGEGENQIVQACFGTINMENGEDQMEFVGFDEENVCSLVFADGAVIEMPEDLTNPVVNSQLTSFDGLEAWFAGFKAKYSETAGFYAIFEMNEEGELTSLSYCYLP